MHVLFTYTLMTNHKMCLTKFAQQDVTTYKSSHKGPNILLRYLHLPKMVMETRSKSLQKNNEIGFKISLTTCYIQIICINMYIYIYIYDKSLIFQYEYSIYIKILTIYCFKQEIYFH